MTEQKPETHIKVEAHTKSVREMLDNVKYSIDFYQREYRWEKKHVTELIDDLEERFLDAYDDNHSRKQVRHYPHYFLGSVIISFKNGHNYIIDGQQRLTSLTLLLIYLHHLQREQEVREEEQVDVRDMIFSTSYGDKSFNLDLPERQACMEALYTNRSSDTAGQLESIRNIAERYSDIIESFPEALKGKKLPYFIDWLKENVDLVQITAYSDEEAYLIFETMNDRGLRLTPTEMLKGYLLANMDSEIRQNEANQLWKERILELIQLAREDELDFFKAWLRAKYAETIRPRKRGASPQDFDKIGTTFHKWVHENEERIGLHKGPDFSTFIMTHFSRFSEHYIRIRHAAQKLTPGFEPVFYNAYMDFTLQYPLELAPIRVEDDLETANRKIRLVATYIDIFIARRIVNFRALTYSTVVYTMFNLMKEIRDLDVQTLTEVLKAKLAEMEETFDSVSRFYLHSQNKRSVHYLLARMTQYLEAQCGDTSSRFDSYVLRTRDPFQVEHVWATNKYADLASDFASEAEFRDYRNRFGGLLLLPRSFNASYGDLPYKGKLEYYFGQKNLLAQSLHPRCYEHNPDFVRFVKESGLPLRPHEHFRKADLDARQALYQQIAAALWHPVRLEEALR